VHEALRAAEERAAKDHAAKKTVRVAASSGIGTTAAQLAASDLDTVLRGEVLPSRQYRFRVKDGALDNLRANQLHTTEGFHPGRIRSRTDVGRVQLRNVPYLTRNLLLFTGSGDHTARIWDVETGTTIKVLEGHAQLVATTCSKLPCPGLAASSSHPLRRL
jgi:hypothetical protein